MKNLGKNEGHCQIILTSITLHLSLRRSYMRMKASDPPMARYSGKTGFIERHLASRTRTDSAWRFTRMLGSLGGALMSVSLKKGRNTWVWDICKNGQIFWEGHKNSSHLPLFVWYYFKWKMDHIFVGFSEYLNFNYHRKIEK